MELQSLDDTGSNELIEVYVNESSSDPPKSTKQKIRKRDYSSLGGQSQEQEVELLLDPDLEIDETPEVNEDSPEDIELNDYSEDPVEQSPDPDQVLEDIMEGMGPVLRKMRQFVTIIIDYVYKSRGVK